MIIETHTLVPLEHWEWGPKSYLGPVSCQVLFITQIRGPFEWTEFFFKVFLVIFFSVQCKLYPFSDLIILIMSSLMWIRVYQVCVIQEAMVWIGITQWRIINMHDYRLPWWCKWDLHSSGILCSRDWQFVTEVPGQPISPILKGQAVQEVCQEHAGTQL
jgi:hypothetical protein